MDEILRVVGSIQLEGSVLTHRQSSSLNCGTVLHVNVCDGWNDASLATLHAFINCSTLQVSFEAVCIKL